LKKWLCIVVLVLTPAVAVADESIVQRALSFLGIKYRFGGESEKHGFDCAGFVRKTFSKVGVHLPRTAAEQYKQGCTVKRDELEPGDLVFFSHTYKRGISHVGIYIGDGMFVHAASSVRRVAVDRLDSPYFKKRFEGGRRIERPIEVEEPEPVVTIDVAAGAGSK